MGNTWTHLLGALFALSCIWTVWPASRLGWQWTMGTIFSITGMFLMFTSSTLYHWWHEGRVKRILRKIDHISIYVMIACSYTPVCIAVIGGWLGWSLFGFLWLLVVGGVLYKLLAMGRWPRLSLAIYLLMGWSGVLMAKPLCLSLSLPSLCLIVAEGALYSGGTYFFIHDKRRNFHAIWHVFVLLGAIAHWSAIVFMVMD